MNKLDMIGLAGLFLSLDEYPDRMERVRKNVSLPGFSPEEFIRTCSDHLVLQTLYCRLRDHGPEGMTGPSLMEHLKLIHQMNLQRNEEIISQAVELSQILGEAGIVPVFLKGTGNLLDGLYADSGERIMSDIDLLLEASQLDTAVNILTGAGYVAAEHKWGNPVKELHSPPLFHPDYQVGVEVHISPVPPPYNRRFPAELLLRDKREASNQPGCFVPSDPHKIIHNFIHSQLSNEGAGTGLLQLRDIYDLWKLSLRTDIGSIMPSMPYRSKAESYLLAAAKIFEDPVHLPVTGGLRQRIYLFHFSSNNRYRWYYRIFRFLRTIFKLIFVRYLLNLPAVLFDGRKRKAVLRKLKDRDWYEMHLKGIRKDLH